MPARSMEGEEQPDPNEASRRSRMRTLLPILRNILFIVFLVMAALMALSSMGVQIGPLIAGAGVVGVAVGFGAQTLVKDVISGIFYLLDDAFRVGEYIISGSYKGTVESFSLRSIKLRHHRGYLYTVPFGTLGAVQNMSRDWVIDKLHAHRPLRHRPRPAEEDRQADRQGPGRRSRARRPTSSSRSRCRAWRRWARSACRSGSR